MLKSFWQILFFVVFKFRLYFIWSRIYRFLFERSYRNKTQFIPCFNSLELIEDGVGKMRWRADAWYALWDAISYPQTAWIKTAAGEAAGDCDDISLAIAAAYQKYLDCFANRHKNGSLIQNLTPPLLLSVGWLEKNMFRGHTVCIFSYTDTKTAKTSWAHWSNWYDGKIRWGFDTLENLIRDINENAICAAAWKPNLELVEIKFFSGGRK